jgi:hypothetical protein
LINPATILDVIPVATNNDITTQEQKPTPIPPQRMTELSKNSEVTCSKYKTDSHSAYLSQFPQFGSLMQNLPSTLHCFLFPFRQRPSGRGGLFGCKRQMPILSFLTESPPVHTKLSVNNTVANNVARCLIQRNTGKLKTILRG